MDIGTVADTDPGAVPGRSSNGKLKDKKIIEKIVVNSRTSKGVDSYGLFG